MPNQTNRTSFYATPDTIAHLRALALDCGLTARTGHGAGSMGSLTLLVSVLANGYARRPADVHRFIAALVALEKTP
jgi:hypothetical protein